MDELRTLRNTVAQFVKQDEVQKGGFRTVEELTGFLTDTLGKRDLKRLITEDGVWKGFVEAAELSSEEKAALYDALKKHLEQKPTDEDDRRQREQQKEQFLQAFPQLKKKLEDHIKKLRDLADHLDEVHRGCTISNVVSGSVSTISGILGLTLLPFTGGVSLIVSLTAEGLGATASLNSLVTTIVEESITLSDESEASRLVGASMNILVEILKILPKISIKLYNSGKGLYDAFESIRDQIQAIRVARSMSQIAVADRNLTSTGRSSSRGLRQVLAAFRDIRIGEAGVRGYFLLWDLCHLLLQSKDLYGGAKTQSAGALRDLCKKLQDKLQVFEEIYKALQSVKPM